MPQLHAGGWFTFGPAEAATEKAFFEKSGRTAAPSTETCVSAEEAQTYGVLRLDAAITFVETKNRGPLKRRTPVDFATLRFPD